MENIPEYPQPRPDGAFALGGGNFEVCITVPPGSWHHEAPVAHSASWLNNTALAAPFLSLAHLLIPYQCFLHLTHKLLALDSLSQSFRLSSRCDAVEKGKLPSCRTNQYPEAGEL